MTHMEHSRVHPLPLVLPKTVLTDHLESIDAVQATDSALLPCLHPFSFLLLHFYISFMQISATVDTFMLFCKLQHKKKLSN